MSDSSGEDIFITQNTVVQNNPNFNIRSDLFSDISSENESEKSDDELMKATQEAEKVIEKENLTRFHTMTDYDIENLISESTSKHSMAKAMWAVRLFNSWKEDRNKKSETLQDVAPVNGELLFMSDTDLDLNLRRFISEIRKKDGTEYRGNTLYEIVSSIQYYLRDKNRIINFFECENFQSLRKVLDAKMKMLAKQGIGITKRQATVITAEQEIKMWDAQILGTDTPQKLLDTLLYTLGINLALRAGQEHRALRVGVNSQLSIKQGDGRRYIHFIEDVSKTSTGGINHRKLEPKTTRVYETPEVPDKCPVRILENYLSLRTKDGKCSALYLRPLKYTTDNCWYADAAVGIHTITQTIARLCRNAGFEGFYSNHSLRATAVTRLFEAGVDEQLITEKTGHRSSAVRGYKRVNGEQLKNVSDLLQPHRKVMKENNINTGDSQSSKSNREICIRSSDLDISVKF